MELLAAVGKFSGSIATLALAAFALLQVLINRQVRKRLDALEARQRPPLDRDLVAGALRLRLGGWTEDQVAASIGITAEELAALKVQYDL